jgi:hypothetical protein
MQMHRCEAALQLSQLFAVGLLPSDESNSFGFERGDFWPFLKISPASFFYRTMAKLSRFKPLRRRLSAASPSFRMPGQD